MQNTSHVAAYYRWRASLAMFGNIYSFSFFNRSAQYYARGGK